jgi:4-amino-4-deoxy-L-arabinose transferase-like glycosyltransferase
LALALRWPHLQTIPRLTDEAGEVTTALQIAFEGARPLVHNDAYRGPAWAYGLAAPLALLGPRPGLPRDYALAIGLATVLAVYLLGRSLAGPRAGLAAGLLQATAFAPIALESHVAWSNHATPGMVTLAGLATWRALGMARVRVSGMPSLDRDKTSSGSGQPDRDKALHWLLLAGLLWGLALQTHPSAVAPLAGAGLWFLAARERRALLRRPATWLAPIACLLVLSPMLVYNAQRFVDEGGIASMDEATDASQPVNRDFGPLALARNLVGLAGQLGRAAGAGRPDEPGEPVPGVLVAFTDAFRPLVTWLYAAILLAALAWATWLWARSAGMDGARFFRIGQSGPGDPSVTTEFAFTTKSADGLGLVASMAWAGILILPLLNRNYQSFYDMRYLGFLLPLAFVALGSWAASDRESRDSAGAAEVAGKAGAKSETRVGSGAWASAAVQARRWLLLASLMLWSLLSVGAYYQREIAAGRTNQPMIEAADRLAQAWHEAGTEAGLGPPQQIWIDKAMRPIKLEGGGDPVRAFDQLLALRSLPAELSDIDELRWFLSEDRTTLYWILAADSTAESLAAEGFPLESVQEAGGWRILVRQPSETLPSSP